MIQEPSTVAASPTTPGGHVRAWFDKAPTKWIWLGVIALFLAVSAAFGGLAEAPVAPLPEVAVGESVTGAQLRLTVDRAVVVDELPGQYITPAAGNRLLLVVATAENVFTRPVLTIPLFGAADNLRPVGVRGVKADTNPLAVIVVSDGTSNSRLQPGVPERLAWVWEVPADAVRADDVIRIDIYDKVYSTEGFVTYGNTFDSPFVSAFLTLPVDDLGTGAGL